MKVGIIGAGTMGSGIAQAFAQTEGYEVFLCDINEEFAANGKKKIAKGFEKRIAKGKMTQEAADAVLAKITTGVKTICTDCDLVVGHLQSGLHFCDQHLFFVHYRDRRRPGQARCRHALLQSRSCDEAGRSDCRPEHPRRGRRQNQGDFR